MGRSLERDVVPVRAVRGACTEGLRSGWRGQGDLAGPFEMLVLLALTRLGEDVAAARVRRHVERWTGREIAEAAVYTTLGRLEAKGWVRSWRRGPIGGEWRIDRRPGSTIRNERCFHAIETLGLRAVRRTLAALDVMRAGLPGMGLAERPWSCWEPTAFTHGWSRSERRVLRTRRKTARESRREARRRREELLGDLRACGHGVDWDGKVRRIEPVHDEGAADRLRERWGFEARRPAGASQGGFEFWPLWPMQQWLHAAWLRNLGRSRRSEWRERVREEPWPGLRRLPRSPPR